MRVTLTEPAIAGSYIIAEQREDGTLVLLPERSDEVVQQFADRALSEDGVLEAFDRLHAAAAHEEGERADATER